MTIVQLIEAVASGEMSYEAAMEVLDTLDITTDQWNAAEMSLRLAMEPH